MVGIKKTISTAIVALAVASVVHADMMPQYPLKSGFRWPLSVCEETVPQQPSDSNEPATFRGVFDPDLLLVGFLPAAKLDAGGASDVRPLEVLIDRQNSFSLCLYTLLGLGLCRTAPWIKRLYIGWSPDWYCSGGPYQIGHSFAIAPDCLISVPAVCFIQPGCLAAQDSLVRYRWGTVMSLWRKSQLTAIVLASRGPPPR